MSLLSKKIALSVTPAGSSPSRDSMNLYLAEPLGAALSQWTGRSSWNLTCKKVRLKRAIEAFDDGKETEACLIVSESQTWLMRLDVSEELERLATANALGVESTEISDVLESFRKIHRRTISETLFKHIATTDVETGTKTHWASARDAKLHVAKNPSVWMCMSVWTVHDAIDDIEYTLDINLDRRILPNFSDEKPEDNPIPNIDVLKNKLGSCRLPVRIVGGRVTLSIADCMKLEIGQTFGLPELDFNAVDMKMPASDDLLVKATLGTHFGAKAVRLSSAVDDDFLVRYASNIKPDE